MTDRHPSPLCKEYDCCCPADRTLGRMFCMKHGFAFWPMEQEACGEHGELSL